MSEEMSKREAELNEQALEGVSGGGYNIAIASHDARLLCQSCDRFFATKTSTACSREQDLANYLLEHGKNSVRFPHQCPYGK